MGRAAPRPSARAALVRVDQLLAGLPRRRSGRHAGAGGPRCSRRSAARRSSKRTSSVPAAARRSGGTSAAVARRRQHSAASRAAASSAAAGLAIDVRLQEEKREAPSRGDPGGSERVLVAPGGEAHRRRLHRRRSCSPADCSWPNRPRRGPSVGALELRPGSGSIDRHWREVVGGRAQAGTVWRLRGAGREGVAKHELAWRGRPLSTRSGDDAINSARRHARRPLGVGGSARQHDEPARDKRLTACDLAVRVRSPASAPPGPKRHRVGRGSRAARARPRGGEPRRPVRRRRGSAAARAAGSAAAGGGVSGGEEDRAGSAVIGARGGSRGADRRLAAIGGSAKAEAGAHGGGAMRCNARLRRRGRRCGSWAASAAAAAHPASQPTRPRARAAAAAGRAP